MIYNKDFEQYFDVFNRMLDDKDGNLAEVIAQVLQMKLQRIHKEMDLTNKVWQDKIKDLLNKVDDWGKLIITIKSKVEGYVPKEICLIVQELAFIKNEILNSKLDEGPKEELLGFISKTLLGLINGEYQPLDKERCENKKSTKEFEQYFSEEQQTSNNRETTWFGIENFFTEEIDDEYKWEMLEEIDYKILEEALSTSGCVSISWVQRRFTMGYIRAAKIVDRLEAAGVIADNSRGAFRKVKVTLEEVNAHKK